MTENSVPATAGRQRRWIWAVACIAVLALGWFAWHSQGTAARGAQKPKGPGPIPVAVGTVGHGDMGVYLDELGTVTPVATVTIVSRVAGAITEVHFKEGQIVKKNELLAVIDPRPYAAAVEQGRGQLARDEAALKNARIDLQRYQNSFKAHAVPQQQLATQQAVVDQDEGTVTLDRGNLAAAQVNVDYTRIVSPVDGRVGLRNIDLGNIVAANGTTGLCVVTQLQPMTVIFTIAEDAIGEVVAQMAGGMPMPVIALDRAKQRTLATGTLLTVDNQVNQTTGTVRARATFGNAHNELFPSQFVNARLLVKTLKDVDLISQAAIQRNNDAAFVYLVNPDGTVQSRNIGILATEGEMSAVTGVGAGDRVVTDGFDQLHNGSKVVQRVSAPPTGTARPGGSG